MILFNLHLTHSNGTTPLSSSMFTKIVFLSVWIRDLQDNDKLKYGLMRLQ